MKIATLKDLESRLHEPLPVHERVRLLNEISEQLHEREPARGAALAREAIELARATGDTPGEAHALHCLGRNLHSQADYPAVLETQGTARSLFSAMDERLATLVREAQVRGTVVTIALADVDHFKGINDRFSHAVGDEVLRCVGEILRSHCRLGDVAGRYGREEFMLVFRALDIRPATEICERVRRAVEIHDWKSIHPQLRATLSLGLASSTSFENPQGVLDAADHWLYEAKHHGRNQVQPVMVVPA